MPAGEHDFDFLVGTFRVRHQRLLRRLADCDGWIEFGGTSTTYPILAGRGLVDDNMIDLPDGAYRAAGMKSYDPASRSWAIWWLDGRNPHLIDVPVIGTFRDGVGTFEAQEVIDGRPVVVRFRWSNITASSARWEQAFSPDGGATWEVNWVMDFERVP